MTPSVPTVLLNAARRAREAGRSVGYARARFPRPLGSRPPLELAVCGIFRDEARYLAEWVTFHRLQGVEHFWLYDNFSEDDWRSELAPEIASGLVTVTPWPHEQGQNSAYMDCLRRHRDTARWIAFIDMDEFLFSPSGRPLPEVLREFDRHPGVVANWRMYGTNGHPTPPEGLVIENYPMRGPDSHPDNLYVKSIAYPRMTVGFSGAPHCFRHRGFAVGEDGGPVGWMRRDPPTVDVLRINHYYSRSMADLARKRARPNVSDGLLRNTAEVPPDEIRDEVILQFLPALKDELANR